VNYVASGGTMTDGLERDLEGNIRGLIKLLPQHLPEGTADLSLGSHCSG
jgi:hypothetical protein